MTSATLPALALALAVGVVPVSAEAARRRQPCGDTSWVVADAPIVPGDDSLAHNGIVLRDGRVALGGACAPARAKRKAGKRGTRLAARWRSCTGVTGPVKLKALADPTCASLTGTVTARKAGISVALDAAAVPTGAVTGRVRVVRAVAVPADARADVLANSATISGAGKTVAADGATIANDAVGAAGWRVRLGDRLAHTDADGVFTLTLDAAPPTELELFHPAEDEPVAVVWAVPHLAPAGAAPTPIDVEITTRGACGMDEAPADEPAYCAASGTGAATGPHAAHHHAGHGHRHGGPVADPITVTWNTGALGTYPTYASNVCADQDGGFGFSGETTLGALTNYLFSTCDTQVVFGCCDNELGSIKVSIKTALGRLTGFRPTPCDRNHKGRLCQDVLQGDVGVQVPAGKVSGQPQIQSVFGVSSSITQPVTPGMSVPVTVHHNGCYGETAVVKTLDELGGTLAPLTSAGGVSKVLHYAPAGAKFTFQPDVPLTYTAGPCPAGATTASDTYELTADGYTATVTFTATCVASTTTTTTVTSGSTTTTIVGRAVRLLFPTGSEGAGTDLCLSRVTGGCVAPVHLPFCSYVHLHAGNEFGIGVDGAGPYQDPELTQAEPCGFGQVVSVPGCGPDTVPDC